MNDKLSSLQLFVRVAHRSSFTKAGRELGLSQPSVSGRIAELEEALHVDLQMADDRQDLIVEGVDVALRIVIRHSKRLRIDLRILASCDGTVVRCQQ